VLFITRCLYDLCSKDVPVYLAELYSASSWHVIHAMYMWDLVIVVLSMKAALFLVIVLCGLSAWYQLWDKSVTSLCRVEEHESTMKLEAVVLFEMLICIYQFSQHHILEDGNFCMLFRIQSGHIQILSHLLYIWYCELHYIISNSQGNKVSYWRKYLFHVHLSQIIHFSSWSFCQSSWTH
jgi:hypothetical protein